MFFNIQHPDRFWECLIFVQKSSDLFIYLLPSHFFIANPDNLHRLDQKGPVHYSMTRLWARGPNTNRGMKHPCSELVKVLWVWTEWGMWTLTPSTSCTAQKESSLGSRADRVHGFLVALAYQKVKRTVFCHIWLIYLNEQLVKLCDPHILFVVSLLSLPSCVI